MNYFKNKKLFFIISLCVIVPGLVSLGFNGLKLGIDFTGGTLYEFHSSKSLENAQEIINTNFPTIGIQANSVYSSGDNITIKMPPLDEAQKKQIEVILNDKLPGFELTRYETVGPTLGKELLSKTLIAGFICIFTIIMYLAYAFKNWRFGLSAILAMLHDSLVIMGVFSILGVTLGVEVDTLFVAALLTILSFSVHDTIVVFDRIREISQKHKKQGVEETVNEAISETLVRSFNNSLTIIFMLLALFLLGGETIKWFVFALLVGTISGTYSSPFNAVLILGTLLKKIDASGK